MRPTPFLSRRAALGVALGATASLLPRGEAVAGAAPIYTRRFSGLGLNGHDPAAHVALGKPAEGSRRFSTLWNGATWRFVSADNRDAFAADPARYAPRYGGYCAWATARGYLAPEAKPRSATTQPGASGKPSSNAGDGTVRGAFIAGYEGVPKGMELHDVELHVLVAVLGALRLAGLETDHTLLEA